MQKMKIFTLSLVLASLGAPALATTYQFHHKAVGLVPRTAPVVAPPVTPEVVPVVVSLSSATNLNAGQATQAYSLNLDTLLTVTGDSSYTSNQVTWQATGLPTGVTLTNGVLSGTPTTAGTYSVAVTATYKGTTANHTYSLVIASQYLASCKSYLAANPGVPSGNYTLDVDGAGPIAAQSYYCDMTSDGGGWTKVVQQYEATPVTNWNGGASGSSFALATSFIPSHTQVGFGKDNQATFVDYVTWTYRTGDIYPAVAVTSPKTGISYQIYRSATGWFYNHDPEGLWYTTWDAQVDARSALSLDAVGKAGANWSFSPRYGSSYVNSRGYAMAGTFVNGGSNAYAWTVWVR